MEDVRKALQPGYDRLFEEFKNLETQIKGKKIALNEMAKSMGIRLPFPQVDEETAGGKIRPKLRMDQFLGKKLATAVAEYLSLSGKHVGALLWPEIVEGLREGGFDIGKSKAAENAARRTILKNTSVFKLVGDDGFGLVSWYPKYRK